VIQASAYYHGGHHLGSWVAHTVARDLIYRLVAAATRGMGLVELLVLAIIAIGVIWALQR
jgi:hypothetical protein